MSSKPPRRKGRRLPMEYIGMAVMIAGSLLFIFWIESARRGYFLYNPTTKPSLTEGWVPYGYAASMLPGVVMMRRGRSMGKRQVVANNARLCLGCRYPLNDLSETGNCPECGDPYVLRLLREGWRRTYPEIKLPRG